MVIAANRLPAFLCQTVTASLWAYHREFGHRFFYSRFEQLFKREPERYKQYCRLVLEE
jgi:hypothetical protein